MKYDESMMREEIYTPHLLVNALSRNLDRPVLYLEDGRVLSASDFRDLISTYSQALQKLGIGRDARVGMLAKNRPEVLHALNAAMLTDSCVVALHPMGGLDDFMYVIADADIETLIFDPDYFQPQVEQLKAKMPQLKHLLALGPTQIGTDLAALAASFSPQPLVAPVCRGDDVRRLAYSGGTTGKPKAIMLTQRSSLTANIILLSEWEWPDDIRHLVCAPLSHSGAAVLMPVLVKGGALVVVPGFEPLAFMQAVEKYRITSTLLVPTMIYALLDHPRFKEFDLSSLETIFYGASTISPARLKEGIAKLGPVFFQFYGQAEAPMSVTVLRRRDHDVSSLTRLASCGQPVPWVHVGLLDADCKEVGPGEPGEICVRGPLLMAGYLNKPEQTAEAFEGGWLHTGDVAVRDPDGFLRIVDRKKDMIITGGFNVYPREIEDILTTHPAIAGAAVIGVPDEKWGEAVKAVVVLRRDAQVDAAELIALVREKKGPVQAPKSVEFIDSLPLSGLGKPDKKALRARFAAKFGDGHE